MYPNPIDAIGSSGMQGVSPVSPQALPSAKPNDGPSFKQTLNSFLSEVDSLQTKADVSIQKMATGEINDVHQVMESVEEANTAFNMMMEIRNKVMDAYQEVMRIRL